MDSHILITHLHQYIANQVLSIPGPLPFPTFESNLGHDILFLKMSVFISKI